MWKKPTACFSVQFQMVLLTLMFLSETPLVVLAESDVKMYERSSELGVMFPKQNASRTVQIRNDWNGKLVIKQIEPSCSCTSVEVANAEVAPGKSTAMNLTIAAPGQLGLWSRDLLVRGEVGGKPIEILYELKADIQPFVTTVGTEDDVLDLGDVPANKGPSTKVFHVQRGKYPARWDNLRIDNSAVPFDVQVRQEGPDQWALTVVYTPLDVAELGIVSNDVTLRFIDKGHVLDEPVSLRLMARSVGPVVAEPDIVVFGAVPEHKITTRIIRIVSPNTAGDKSSPFRVTSVRTTIPKLLRAQLDVRSTASIRVECDRQDDSPVPADARVIVTVESGGKQYDLNVPCIIGITSPVASSTQPNTPANNSRQQ